LRGTLSDSAFFVGQLSASNKKLVEHVFADQEEPVSIHMNRIDFIYCKISIKLKQNLQIVSHGDDSRSTTKEY
jgi:hypothetical protein